MKTTFVKTTFFDQWIIKLFLASDKQFTYYKFSVFWEKETKNQFCSQRVYPTEEEAYIAAHFLCLRASLDREKSPALIVDSRVGYILSTNLLAFKFFGVDAVGLKTLDFAADLKNHEQIYQELQQSGKSCQPILLRNADGNLIECEIEAQIEPHYSRWAIFRLGLMNNCPVVPKQIIKQ